MFISHVNFNMMIRPFLDTGNGFFAAWLGCISSLNLMVMEMKDSSPER